MANLQRHSDVLDVDAVAISHRHPDHLVDLYPFFYARMFHPDRPRGLPVYAAPEVFDHARALLTDQGGAELGSVFDLRTVEPGSEFEAGPFLIATGQMAHPVPTLGMRIRTDEAVLAYSADTGPTDELVRLADGAETLVSEATWPDPPPDARPIHLSGRQAGEHAARAGVGRLILSHVWPTHDREIVAERARSAFDGAVELAAEGLEVEV